MKFFLDNCLSPRLASALNELVVEEKDSVIHLRQKFSEGIEDPVWIGELAAEGNWVIVSSDTRIPKNPQNRTVWRQSGLTGFFLKKGWTNHVHWEQAWRLVRWWPEIARTAKRVKRGEGFWVPPNFGKIEVVKHK